MSQFLSHTGAVFVPTGWVLPGCGTNGYITSWGPALSGAPAPLPA